MNTKLVLVGLALLLTACAPAVRVPPVIKDAPVSRCLTNFTVQFHEYYQPGTFNARLDGADVTSQFSPAGVAGGTASMPITGPFRGGQPLLTGGTYIGVPQAPGTSIVHLPSGTFTHTLRTTGTCVAGTVCAESDEYQFNPVSFRMSPAPLNVPVQSAVGGALKPDRNLAAPLTVSISPMAPATPQHGPAAHIRVNGAPAGAPVNVTLPVGSAGTTFTVQATAAGSFFLIVSAPGCQAGSVLGNAH